MRPRRRPDGDSIMVLCPTPPLAAAAKDNVVNDWIAKNVRAASSSGSRSAREPRSGRRSAVHKSNCRGASATAESSPPGHRRDASSMTRRRGLSPIDSASSVAFSPRRDLVKNYRVHPTH